MRLVLASRSPRRAELLSLLGVEYSIEEPDVDESRHPGEHPHAYVERLARAKAEAVAGDDVVALGADTVVVHDGSVLGKPGHPAEARAMLGHLSGDIHHVVTGVAVSGATEGRLTTESVVESATVRFGSMTDGEIEAYVAGGEPLDCAGAYAMQGQGGIFVEGIDGHPSTVIGLPLPATARLLARRGITSLG